MIAAGTRVAVVDDRQGQAETAAGIAEEAELVPSIFSEKEGAFDSTDQLLKLVGSAGCDAVICDHRLSQTGFASFTGAEFVAQLFRERIPGVLLSTFSAIDSETSIKLHRAEIPSLIDRSALDPGELLAALRRCESELAGEVSPERQLSRTLVRIESASSESGVPVLDAIVHTWDPNHAVRFPLSLIEDPEIRDAFTTSHQMPRRLFANVNIGCRSESDLYYQDFEWAPEPKVSDLDS